MQNTTVPCLLIRGSIFCIYSYPNKKCPNKLGLVVLYSQHATGKQRFSYCFRVTAINRSSSVAPETIARADQEDATSAVCEGSTDFSWSSGKLRIKKS